MLRRLSNSIRHAVVPRLSAFAAASIPHLALANAVTNKLDDARDNYAIPIAGSIIIIALVICLVMWGMNKAEFWDVVKWFGIACAVGTVVGVAGSVL